MATHAFVGWEELPNAQVPMVLHNVQGKDEREGNSPSWFNVAEVQVRKPPLHVWGDRPEASGLDALDTPSALRGQNCPPLRA